MTSVKAALAQLAARMAPERPGLPEAELVAAPATVEELAHLLRQATEAGMKTLIWGGGTHQGYGGRVEPDLLLVTTRLNRIAAWEPDDLTVVVGAGVEAADLELRLAERGQSAILPTYQPGATVGGLIAAGISCYRRGRYGPTRDRVLEVTLVTGDGRVVKAGGRVVKNVTGYDLPRLAAGSYGALGVIAEVCLKLWPVPPGAATVTVDDPELAASRVYRPLAVITTSHDSRIYLSGTDDEVAAQIERLGGEAIPGWQWPAPLPGQVEFSLRVPPALVTTALDRIPSGWSYIAQHGVGLIETGGPDLEGAADLRGWAESVGGALVVAAGPDQFYQRFDPWGKPPPTVDLQRRLVAAFDPARILNPGRLPGGI